MSWHRDPLAVAQDALQAPWDPVTYLFPPVPLLPKVVRKVKDERLRAIFVHDAEKLLGTMESVKGVELVPFKQNKL